MDWEWRGRVPWRAAVLEPKVGCEPGDGKHRRLLRPSIPEPARPVKRIAAATSVQKGLATASSTMPIMSSVGASFMIR